MNRPPSTPPDAELDRLLSDFTDGLLDEPGSERLESRLETDPAARQRYLHYQQLNASLTWEYADAASERPVASAMNLIRPSWMRRRTALAATATAAAGIAAIFVVAFSMLLGPRPLATLDLAEGSVTWLPTGSSELIPLSPGAPLSSGTLINESESGFLQFHFRDGTLVTLSGEAELALSEDRGKRLRLQRGRIAAEVTTQPAGRPLRIATPSAEIEVLGTVLSVSATGDQTFLNVDEGLVRMRRLADGQTTDVPGRHQALASLDTSTDLVAREANGTIREWRFTPDRPNGKVSKGRFAMTSPEPHLASVPYVAGRQADGTKIVRHGVCLYPYSRHGNGRLTVQESDVLRLRYRASSRPTLLLITNRKNGSFGGNFEFMIPGEDSSQSPDAWQTAEVPLHAFELCDGLRGRNLDLDDNRIGKVLVSVSNQNDLEIAEVSITQP